ncbi:MAG TPA: ATP-binding protein [archaeon]|nr:ATP-binding protein [archaeon]
MSESAEESIMMSPPIYSDEIGRCIKCKRKLRIFPKISGEQYYIYEPCEECFPEERKRVIREYSTKKRQAQLAELMKESQLSPIFQKKTFDNFKAETPQQKNVLEDSRHFAEYFSEYQDKGTWLAFLGNCGTGKGHLASAIVNEVIRLHLKIALYITFIDVVSKIKRNWDRSEEEINKLRNVDLLVLDEIGVQFDTQAERVILHRILGYRYDYLKPTILTSNLNLKQLEQIVGERITDRLHDRERDNKVYLFTWESHRRKES